MKNFSLKESNSPRRVFLRNSSALLGLPLLESFRGSYLSAGEVKTTTPKRLVYMGIGWGVTHESWFQSKAEKGAWKELPKGLAPLSKHKKDLTVIRNCSNNSTHEAHWGSTFWLTGANQFAIPGQGFHNSISADQVAARSYGLETRFNSVQLGTNKANGQGHGNGLSLAWNHQGKPLSGYDSPMRAYSQLFSADDTPLEVTQARFKKKRSILDTVMLDAKYVSKGLNKNDRDKMDEYFQSVRDIETRIAKEEAWIDVPKKTPSKGFKEPQKSLDGYQEIKVMIDIMVAAMQVDATRVLTYRLPVDSLITSLDATITGHNMSHYNGNKPRQAVSENRDRALSELLAYFIDKLKSTKEVDGTSLFDHICLTFGSNIKTSHTLKDCPVLITGKGAGLKLGHHLVPDVERMPLCNVWLTQLRGLGLNVESHGDSTGIIKELLA